MNRLAAKDAAPEAQIIEVATQHIRQFGAKRLTIVALAQEMGMSHANVYRYYASRQAVLEAVTAQWLKPIELELQMIADGPDPAYDKLERMLGALNRRYREKLENDSILFQLFVSQSEIGSANIRRHRLNIHASIQRVLEEGIASSQFSVGDLRRCLALVYDMMHRFISPTAIKMDAQIPASTLRQRMDRLIHILLKALQSRR